MKSNDLIGTWISSGSSLPKYLNGSDELIFAETGKHLWRYPQKSGKLFCTAEFELSINTSGEFEMVQSLDGKKRCTLAILIIHDYNSIITRSQSGVITRYVRYEPNGMNRRDRPI